MTAAIKALVSQVGRIAVTFITVLLLTEAKLYLANEFHTLLTSGGRNRICCYRIMSRSAFMYKLRLQGLDLSYFIYHGRYDFMTIWFLFATWLDQLLSKPLTGGLWIARLVILGLLGASLWFPVTEAMYLRWPIFYVIHVLWLGALGLCVWDRCRHCA
jgi:hypothetical protein